MSVSNTDRSTSRGRDITSVGRGGAGNFVRGESASRNTINRALDGDERGRTVEPRIEASTVTHSGRGGSGNIRSPSRDPIKEADERAYEQQVLARSRERSLNMTSSGRGGGGNISGSRSRSRDPVLVAVTSGRGGAGNMHEGTRNPIRLTSVDDEERGTENAKHHNHVDGTSTSHGRGGQGNISTEQTSQPHSTHPVTVTGHRLVGRGGQGNEI